jgi:hypothetical protein
MKPRYTIPTAVVSVVGIILVSVFTGVNSSMPRTVAAEPPTLSKVEAGFSPYVDKDGKISLPTDYRQKWTHLGSWAVAKKKGETIHEMHDVYTPPETIAAYNKTGEFPDGTVLVKEVRETKTDQLTTGHVAWPSEIKIWFVMIKDQQGRFEESDHWGEGWGWALFEAKDPTKNVSVDYASSCIDCHIPVEDTDWIYVYGYPDLKQPNE